MSLQTKFAVLIGTLALTVLLALGVAMWAVNFIQAEVRTPIRSMSGALESLGQLDVHVEQQRAIAEGRWDFENESPLRPEPREQSGLSADLARTHEELDKADGQMDLLLNRLDEDETTLTRAGKTTFANLRARLANAKELRTGWGVKEAARAGFAEARAAYAGSLFDTHVLLERMQTRILTDTQAALRHGMDIRSRMRVVVGSAMAIVVLTCVLGLALTRRWVLRPVAALRVAAARIAAGDLEHRIAVEPVRDELAQLSTEVNAMAGMVKSMQDERIERERLAAIGEMVRRLAHNLRNPLGGIRGLAELSRGEAATLGAAPEAARDIQENQRRIILAVDRFEEWLTELLNVTKPTSVNPQAGDPRKWLAGLVDVFRPSAQSKGIELQFDQTGSPESVRFDARHLEHALAAIVSNAIEATASIPASNGPRRVGVISRCRDSAGEPTVSGESGHSWEIQVWDDGPGISSDLRDRIFKPYFTTKPDGNGIGLAVAQQIVAAHRGRIEVSDAAKGHDENGTTELGPRGAVFSVRLPLDVLGAAGSSVARTGQAGARIGQDTRH